MIDVFVMAERTVMALHMRETRRKVNRAPARHGGGGWSWRDREGGGGCATASDRDGRASDAEGRALIELPIPLVILGPPGPGDMHQR